MNLLTRKVHLFCVSNIIISFAITGLLGINYCTVPEDEVSNNGEVAMLDTDELPLSQKGEDEKNKVTEVKKENKVTNKTTNTSGKIVATVAKQEVKASKTYVPATYSAVTGQAIVDYAMKYLGLRYVSGGYSLSTGTDCSGFTKLIYAEFGISLSRAVKAQSGNGTFVSKADLQKGDLVFYGYGNGVVRHVGIYIGNGQVLHESNPRDGVKINSVNMMQYITARRVINSTAIKMVEEKLETEKVQEEANNLEDVVLDTDDKTISENNNLENVEVVESISEDIVNPSISQLNNDITKEEESKEEFIVDSSKEIVKTSDSLSIEEKETESKTQDTVVMEKEVAIDNNVSTENNPETVSENKENQL